MASASSLNFPQTETLLHPPKKDKKYEPIHRARTDHKWIAQFDLKQRTYQQQYADMYFLRLAKLKPPLEELARQKFVIEDEKVQRVQKLLDVRQGELCWVMGTVYMDMPLKPNVLEDISKDHWISAPPGREKFNDPLSDQMMLEDESGRIKLIGGAILSEILVTGCVIAVMGNETADGDFQVYDLLCPDLPPQPPLPSPKKPKGSRYVAFASGLNISGARHENLETNLMVEYLLGELTAPQDQHSASKITRLILAGNSFSDCTPLGAHEKEKKKGEKKYGYDAASYNSRPTTVLDNILYELCTSIPVDIMPGESDPTNVSLPQQPIHPTMFPHAKAFYGTTFHSVTNPYSFEIDGVRCLGTSGQTINDIYKYVAGDDRLLMMESTLRWRHIAPTCPDTLWSYPFQNKDPFILEECPHVYFVGNQPRFEAALIEGTSGQKCRIISIPCFAETGELVLLDLESPELSVEVVKFKVEGG